MAGDIATRDDAAAAAPWAAEPDPPSACLNCGVPLAGAYCHRCGQAAHLHDTLASVIHDLLHGAFHFEGRVWRTLPMLAFRPGGLTRRYIAGERARFVSPLAAFLFGVFLLFAAIETFGPPLHPNVTVETNGRKISGQELDAEAARTTAEVARLEGERRQAVARHTQTRAIDAQLEDARAEQRALATGERIAHGLTNPGALAPSELRTGFGPLDERIAAARANPALVLYQVQISAHKFAWALIPLSLPFLWLMFAWRREFRLFDHSVFVTYSQSAVLLLFAAMAALGAAGVQADWALGLIPLHWFVHLRGAYRLGVWGALWRTVGLIVSATCVMTMFAVLMIAIGLAG